MDQKQLLREIAYYSKILKERQQNALNSQQSRFGHSSKYKYVRGSEEKPAAVKKSPVLPNPTYSHNRSHVQSFNKVYVNPSLLVVKKQLQPVEIPANPSTSQLKSTVLRKSRYKLVQSTSIAASHINQIKRPSVTPTRKPIVIQRYKLVRATSLNSPQKPARKRRVSFRSKYSFCKVGKSPEKVRKLPILTKTKYKLVRNKYKLDRRKSHEITPKRPVKYSANCHNTSCSSKAYSILIRGHKYLIDKNQKTLRLAKSDSVAQIDPSIKGVTIGGVLFVRKNARVLVRANYQKKILNVSKQQKVVTLSSKLRKNNIPCAVFRKTGKCKGKDAGRCSRVHNPDQIAICRKFLQGACIDADCTLSHKISTEIMPTCKFFLDGCCIRENCPYLHVKLNSKVELCKDFLGGYCKNGVKCEKRHEFRIVKSLIAKRKTEPTKTGETVKEAQVDTEAESSEVNPRYFVDKTGNGSDSAVVVSGDGMAASRSLQERPKIGELPCYIPLDD